MSIADGAQCSAFRQSAGAARDRIRAGYNKDSDCQCRGRIMTIMSDGPDAEAIRQRYRKVDAATVSDVLDALGYLHQGLAGTFGPYPETAGKLAGWAYTICGEMRPYAGGGDAAQIKAGAG